MCATVVAGYGRPDAEACRLSASSGRDLTLARGRNLGIVGESGCGKSTRARVIAGILPAAKGEIPSRRPVAGAGFPQKRRREDLRDLQIVFQSADTRAQSPPVGREILGRPLAFYHGHGRRAREARIDQLLDMVRLPRPLRHRRPGELSGGQKQRVNLARALAAEARLNLCDEINLGTRTPWWPPRSSTS